MQLHRYIFTGVDISRAQIPPPPHLVPRKVAQLFVCNEMTVVTVQLRISSCRSFKYIFTTRLTHSYSILVIFKRCSWRNVCLRLYSGKLVSTEVTSGHQAVWFCVHMLFCLHSSGAFKSKILQLIFFFFPVERTACTIRNCCASDNKSLTFMSVDFLFC